ncbi:MAG: spore photoproduct lyase family protein [Nocardioidaceae bacterium]
MTSGTIERGHEGTTFEMSCYTDPLGIEHLTGSLAAAITRVGSGEFGRGRLSAVHHQVRCGRWPASTCHTDVAPECACRSMPTDVATRFEGGTAPMPARLAALRTMALAGYRVGLTIAPVMPVPGLAHGVRTAAGRRGRRRSPT